jgi:phosphatidylserine/phosphatidylglycerophosphate/cardiolipin synthase-like enzyme
MALRTPARPTRRPTPATSPDAIAGLAWWARADAPVRVATAAVPLVDGRAAMLAMCTAFLTARRTIWLADWDLHADLDMVRGRDQRAGPDGSPEQDALIARLRAAGLDADAIAQWTTGRLRVVEVLGFAARRGVDVRMLLWAPYDPLGVFHMVNNPAQQRRILADAGVDCRLDKNSRSPLHLAQALHQKCAVVDDHLAFVGGVDLTVQTTGDFDRWDTPDHPFDSTLRNTDVGYAPHPWHDCHVLLEGAPAQDVETNIRQRWDECDPSHHRWRRRTHLAVPPLRHYLGQLLSGGVRSVTRALRHEEAGDLPDGAGPQIEGPGARVQIVRTIPALTYRFAPAGIHGIVEAYLLALRQARRFVYLESQYLWLEGFHGLDVLRLGWQSHYMLPLFEAIAAAAERGCHVAVVLPDHPNCGRQYTGGGIAWLRQHAPAALAANRLHFYTLATCTGTPGAVRYRPIYVHAKVGIVDDRWATAGSANLNSRGMSHDAEINVAVLDGDFARGLRLALWAEHLGFQHRPQAGWPASAALPLPVPLAAPQPHPEPPRGPLGLVHPTQLGNCAPDRSTPPPADLDAIADPLAGLALFARRARENLDRLRHHQPLVGQLLPYLGHDEPEAHGLTVDAECGFLDPLREAREHIAIRHPGKYT